MANVPSAGVPPPALAFSTRLSPRAQAAFQTWRWSVDDARRLPPEELGRRLSEKGIPPWPVLAPIEEAFGGTCVRVGGSDLELGITAALGTFERDELVDAGGRITRVPAGYWGIYTVFLDEDGGVWLFHDPDEWALVEPSLAAFFEQQAMMGSFRAWAPDGFVADLGPSGIAARLAAERGAPVVGEVTNPFHRWWQDGEWTLFEAAAGEPAMIWTRTLGGLMSALDAGARLEPGFRARPRPPADEAQVEELEPDEVAARAPSVESLRGSPGARRVELLGQPSIYAGKPASSGSVWLSGDGDRARVDVLERCGEVLLNCWELTPRGGHALLTSRTRKA